MRSVVAVLPASMCAMMPMFLSCGSGVNVGIYLFPAVLRAGLPACLRSYNRGPTNVVLQMKRAATDCRPRSPYRRGSPCSLTARGPSRSKLLEPRRGSVSLTGRLPAVVGERLVRLGHPVSVLLLLD